MAGEQALIATVCAICGEAGGKEVYAASFGPEHLTPAIFSARRAPDRVHYRMVRCRRCGLLRADPRVPEELLAGLYEESAFTYGPETAALRRTYGGLLDRLRRFDPTLDSLLEIGCGSGFLLEEAQARGFSRVAGIEPSAGAIAAANDLIRPLIRQGMLRGGHFPPGSFDVVCMFQVLDHLADPRAALEACRELLRPGGLFLTVNHDAGALSARLLGQRSPIVDVEHPFLYSQDTAARLLEGAGFEVLSTGRVMDRHRLGYLARFLPLGPKGRELMTRAVSGIGLADRQIAVPLGNLYLIAKKK